MTPTAPDLTAETRPMDLSAWPPAETDLYDAGVATESPALPPFAPSAVPAPPPPPATSSRPSVAGSPVSCALARGVVSKADEPPPPPLHSLPPPPSNKPPAPGGEKQIPPGAGDPA